MDLKKESQSLHSSEIRNYMWRQYLDQLYIYIHINKNKAVLGLSETAVEKAPVSLL